ncbi:MAG: anti-sigma F factor [Bacillota bacterium]
MPHVRNQMTLEFMSLSENESFARVAVAAFASQLGYVTLPEIADLKTAVSEAVTNAIIHGYEHQSGMVRIEATLYENGIQVSVIDQGVGIPDIDKAREMCFTTKPELERSGMGFAFMESMTDELTVDSKVGEGTTVTMTKWFRSAPAQ